MWRRPFRSRHDATKCTKYVLKQVAPIDKSCSCIIGIFCLVAGCWLVWGHFAEKRLVMGSKP